MMNKNIVAVILLLLTTSCASKYESFVSGAENAEPELVQAAITELVDTYSNSEDSKNKMILLHPAENDGLVMPLLEDHLRETGYAVTVVDPDKKSQIEKIDPDSDGVELCYRASYVDGLYTYCLGLHENATQVCRVYEEGEAASAITTIGLDTSKAIADKPVGDAVVEDPVKEPIKDPLQAFKSSGIYGPMPDDVMFSELTAKHPSAIVPETEIPMLKTPNEEQATTDKINEVKPSNTGGISFELVNASTLAVEQIREDIERFVSELPDNVYMEFDTEQGDGESPTAYRERLLGYVALVSENRHHLGRGYMSLSTDE